MVTYRARLGLMALAVAVLAAGAGCVPPSTTRSYGGISFDTVFEQVFTAEMVSVSRSQKTQDRYGAQTVAKSVADGVTKYSFDDRLLHATVIPEERRIALEIANKSEHPFRIRWEDAAFVGPDGSSNPVMHVGTRYSECRSSKPAAVVVQGSSVTDEAIPCSLVQYTSGSYGGWRIDRLYAGMIAGPGDSAQKFAHWREMTMGKRSRLLLPIESEDVVNDYVFEFEARSVRTQKFDGAGGRVP